MIDFLQTKIGLELERAWPVLQEFRAYRRERTGKGGGPTSAREWVMPDKPPEGV